MKVHMAVLIASHEGGLGTYTVYSVIPSYPASHEGGLGTYTVYSIIPSYPAGNKKLVATLLVSHEVPLNNCNKTSSHLALFPGSPHA